MRICIDARAAVSVTDGIGRYAVELLRAYSERNDDNRYIVLKGVYTPMSFAFDERFSEVVTPLERFGIREQISLPGLLAGFKVDLLHSLHATLPIRYRGRKVMTVHDIFPILIPWSFGRNGVKNAAAAAYYASLVRMSLKCATLVIVDSDHTGRDLREHMGFDRRRLRRIYLGIDHLQGAPEERKEDVLSRFSLARPFLITVTNYKPHKNTRKVLDAFRLIRKEIPGMSLAIVGNDARDFAGNLGRPDHLEAENVHVLGYVGDDALGGLLSAAAAFVFPSLYEGFGFPVLEAMAAGTPVVTSAVASLPEVGGDAVLYVDPNDPSSIAGAVLGVCRDEALRSSLRARGLAQAGKFKWKETAAQTIGIYEEAVRDSQASIL
jgi:glycosyltransferase involved in cell wall biosynthesis